jgi:uncharacterized protein (DUF305 family)
MNGKSHGLAMAAAVLLLSAAAARADDSDHDYDLPAICTSDAHHMMDQEHMGSMSQGAEHMDQAHQDLMHGMDAMHGQMMQGMMAADLDVAFVCGMIPHHQGAIDMAKAELAHGDDPWVRALAEQIIAAQEKEIADMRAWLEKQSQ